MKRLFVYIFTMMFACMGYSYQPVWECICKEKKPIKIHPYCKTEKAKK